MEAKIDGILGKMESTSAKVDLYKSSKVKLPMAELDYLKTLEDARDFMNSMVAATNQNRQELADIFGGDCSRIARIRTVLDAVQLSDMNCNDQRVRTCTEACETIEKVLEDMGLGWCLKKAKDEEKVSLVRRRSSIDREAALKAAQQLEAQQAAAVLVEVTETDAEKPPKKASKAADLWAQCCDEERVLACTEPTELHALEREATASRSGKIGNWMIWMVHRAHLDDPSLSKFDFTNLKMPDGNLEPRVSPKLAVAMESNSHIEHLLMGCTNLQDQEAAILAVSLRANRTLKVLNIDTNAIQPLTLESIANGTSVNQALSELRCNNCASGRLVTEAFLRALKSNPSLCKLGYPVTDAYFRGEIDKQLTRNNDAARKRRLEEKKRREAEGDTSPAAAPAGYPKPAPKAAPKAEPKAEPASEVDKPETKEKEPAKADAKAQAEAVPASAEPEAVKPVEKPDDPAEAAAEAKEPEAKVEAEAVPASTEPEAVKAVEKLDDPAEAAPETKEPEAKVAAKVAEPAEAALPGMVEAPVQSQVSATLRGYLYKKSPSARLLKSWDWRYFVLHEGRLMWWRRDRDLPSEEVLGQADPAGCKGFVNLKLSSANVVPDKTNPMIFALVPAGGAWKEGSLKDMSDASRAFEFDCTSSAHSREEWMKALGA
ncbi:unnamed protein product [Effrenium voratum]|uniref:PH domain-containing protein n=1 Tax=Effrenium voratum TaxID=2562239 RepID=A0AA36MWT5_9DINO|nr:unnamed protein product [Effrenium voratum]